MHMKFRTVISNNLFCYHDISYKIWILRNIIATHQITDVKWITKRTWYHIEYIFLFKNLDTVSLYTVSLCSLQGLTHNQYYSQLYNQQRTELRSVFFNPYYNKCQSTVAISSSLMLLSNIRIFSFNFMNIFKTILKAKGYF